MEIYTDDFTIYGTTFEEEKTNLENVLSRCLDYNHSLNSEKNYDDGRSSSTRSFHFTTRHPSTSIKD